jgi:hypothetical protein
MSEARTSLGHPFGRSHCSPDCFFGSGTEKGFRKLNGSPTQHEETHRTADFLRRLDKQPEVTAFRRKHSGSFRPPEIMMNHRNPHNY